MMRALGWILLVTIGIAVMVAAIAAKAPNLRARGVAACQGMNKGMIGFFIPPCP
jgi:hypothetical protein